MKGFIAIISTISLFLFFCSGVKAQDIGPDTLMVVEQLPSQILPDTIDLNNSHFGVKTIPYHGKVISKFGRRGSRMHTGTDVKLAKGDTVRCAFDGVVDIASTHYGYGLLVTVKHANQMTTYYAHLSRILVQKGQPVRAGEVLGLGGATGRATTAHLHFELRIAGKPINAQEYFDFENNTFFATTISTRPKAKPADESKQLAQKSSTGGTGTVSSVVASELEILTHIISRGDTLYQIAKRYGTTVAALCHLNGISAQSILKIGSVIKIR
ncbi:MAG: M23 family metallopeptidase [Breznakibacter sp.]